jgi:transcriptional regulator of arginine metabolism
MGAILGAPERLGNHPGSGSRPPVWRDVLKLTRQAAILEIVRHERVPSQQALRERLARRGFDVAQATLSRDLRELGIVRVPDKEGGFAYASSSFGADPSPALRRLLPALYLSTDGVDNLLVLRTVPGGAQPVGVAIDGADWPEVVGTIAGDDTVLVILRKPQHFATVVERIQTLAGEERE